MFLSLIAIIYAGTSLFMAFVFWAILRFMMFPNVPRFESLNDLNQYVQNQSEFQKSVSLKQGKREIYQAARSNYILKGFAVWILGIPLTFLVTQPILIMIFSLLIILTFVCERSSRPAFLILIIAAIPNFFFAVVPFPGLEQLITIHYWKVAIVATILLPEIFKERGKNKNTLDWNVIDTLVVLFVVLTSLLTFRVYSFTHVARLSIDQFLIFIVLYFGISRLLTRRIDVEKCLLSFVLVAVIFCFIGIWVEISHWDFYQSVNKWSRLFGGDIRWGLIRIEITVNNVTIGLFIIAAIFAINYFYKIYDIPKWLYLGLLFLYVIGLVFTGTRSLFLGLVVAVLTSLILKLKNIWGLIIGSISIVIFGAILISIILLDPSTYDLFDETGNYSYRARLLQTAINYISHRPFFGDPLYESNEFFRELIQGQGIIDFVNLYLQIALEFGLVTLLIFVCILVGLIVGLYSKYWKLNMNRLYIVDAEKHLLSTMLCIVVAYALIISTTSAVALVMHVGVIFCAISRAIISIRKSDRLSARMLTD